MRTRFEIFVDADVPKELIGDVRLSLEYTALERMNQLKEKHSDRITILFVQANETVCPF